MDCLKYIKQLLLLLLTILLGVQITYAKTELVLPQNQVSFSSDSYRNEQTQNLIPKAFGIEKEENLYDYLTAGHFVDKEQQESIKKIFTKEGIIKLGEVMAGNILATMNDKDKRAHALTKGSVQAIFLWYALANAAGKSLKELLDNAQDLAQKLDRAPLLQKRVTDLIAVKDKVKIKQLNKLLDDVAPAKLERLIAKVDAKKVDLLLDDIAGNKSLRKALLDIEGLVKAWKELLDFTHLRKDVDILTSVSKILDNHPSFMQAQGDKVKSIIDKLGQAGAKCNSCPPNTQNLVKPYMKSIDQHLDDLEYMIANFGNKEGFSGTNSIINEMAASGPKADGGSFLMHFIKNNPSEFQNLTKFEFRFNDDLLNRADVLVGNIKYEMKSWSNGGSTWNAFFGGSGNSYQQFLSYLQNTNSLDNLKYVFNNAKASESQVKNAFKGLISNASKKQEIFDSMTSQLKQSLNIEFVSDLTTSKIDDIVNAIVRI